MREILRIVLIVIIAIGATIIIGSWYDNHIDDVSWFRLAFWGVVIGGIILACMGLLALNKRDRQ